MHRLTALALALLVLFASVLPSVLARETNADRLKRGDPPLPPTQRETAKRQQSSPILVTGVIEVRNIEQTTVLGYVEMTSGPDPIVSLGDPNDPASDRLQVLFSSSGRTLVATNLDFSPPFGPPFYLNAPDGAFLDPVPLLINPNSNSVRWFYNPLTQQLTVTARASYGDAFAFAGFVLNESINQLGIFGRNFGLFPGLGFPSVTLFLVPVT